MTTTPMTDVKALEQQHVLQVYRRQPVVFERGSGMRLFDDKGRAYLDFLSGIGVASLGHAHAGLAKAIAGQAETLLHTSNLYFHPLQGELAARLSVMTGLDFAFFCNSGTEAVEACLKFARKYWHAKGETSRTKFVAFTHSFHGRTLGSLSVTWDSHYRTPFEPLVPGVTFVDVNGPSASGAIDVINASITNEHGGGHRRADPGRRRRAADCPDVAAAIAAACKRTGTLLIADEVQTGSGRTGTFIHSRTIGLDPDLIALGKALGAGVPIGAALLSRDVAAAAAPAITARRTAGTCWRAARRSCSSTRSRAACRTRLRACRDICSRRCAGWPRGTPARSSTSEAPDCWRASSSTATRPTWSPRARARSVINRTATTVVRLLPPYIVTERDVDEAIGILDAVLSSELLSSGLGPWAWA